MESYGDRYNKGNSVSDPYSRGTARLEENSNELLADHDKEKAGSNRFHDDPLAGREPAPGEEDVEGIKKQIRYVKQESANSTENAQAAKVEAGYEEERREREHASLRAMMDVRETQNRIGRAAGYGREGDEYDEEGIVGGSRNRRLKTEEQIQASKAQRSRYRQYQFEANASDDEIEPPSQDEISDITERLNALGKVMRSELDAQCSLNRVDVNAGKTDGLDLKLSAVANKQKRIS